MPHRALNRGSVFDMDKSPCPGVNAGLLSNCQPSLFRRSNSLYRTILLLPLLLIATLGLLELFFCHHYLKIKMGLVLNPLCARREGHLTQWICCSYGKCWA